MGVSTPTRRDLARIARRYYVDGASKVEIGEELGLSRFKVARMLEQATESGVVTISIDDAGDVDPILSARLRDHLGLRECVVVQGRDDVQEMREDVGAAAGRLLTQSLRAGQVLGIAGAGRSAR